MDKRGVVSNFTVAGAMDFILDPKDCNAKTFTFADMKAATENLKEENFIGEGGFGKVYKGRLPDTGEIVAIKQLDQNGCQGIREFVVEVTTLCDADHPHLVKLIGYCAEGDQRLLVYEYMPLGSLEAHLYDIQPNQKALDWNIRMKIAAGAAIGLEYLHSKKPPIIYRDLKCSNILLGEGYHAKLSDFGLAKVGPQGDQTHVSTRVMGTYGYCAPDYALTGQLTFKSDIYSFGVVLLEIITGRKAIDITKNGPEQNLVDWKNAIDITNQDQTTLVALGNLGASLKGSTTVQGPFQIPKMADPAMDGRYPVRGLYQALAIAAMSIQEQSSMRPLIADIVKALKYLASQKHDTTVKSNPLSRRRFKEDKDGKCGGENKCGTS